MNKDGHPQSRRAAPLPHAERLEPRVLYSADAVASLMPLLADDDDTASIDRDIAALSMAEEHVGHNVTSAADTEQTSSASDAIVDDVSSVKTEADDIITTADEMTPGVGVGHVIFVDSGVPDAEQVVEQLGETGAHVVLIEDDDDGLQVVSRVLAQQSGLDAVHLFAHGSAGSLVLGTASLDATSLSSNADGIAMWGDALGLNGDLLIYGCNVGLGDAGVTFIDDLAMLTGADVAASDDITGTGGDWELETRSGKIDVALIDAGALDDDWQGALATLTVNTTEDLFRPGGGAPPLSDIDALNNWLAGDPSRVLSLREAIRAANVNAGVDTIVLAAETYQLTRGGEDDVNRYGDLDIRSDIIIQGVSSSRTNIDMGNVNVTGDVDQRVFELANGASLTLKDVAIRGGEEDGFGGGIMVRQNTSLTLEDVEIAHNRSDSNGGGIYVEAMASFTATNVSFVENLAGIDGGALYSVSTVQLNGGSVTRNYADDDGGGFYLGNAASIRGVSFFQNRAADTGGAVHERTDQLIEISFSTFGANITENLGGTRGDAGGAIFSGVAGGVMTIENSTFKDNIAGREGGAIAATTDNTTQIRNSVFEANRDKDGIHEHLQGNFESRGFNVFSGNEASNHVSLLVSDRQGIDPGLAQGLLAANGQLTYAPEPGSILINGGGSSSATIDGAGGTVDAIPDIGAHQSGTQNDVYYYVDDNSTIWRTGTQIDNPQQILHGPDFLSDIAVDIERGYIYWIESTGVGENAVSSVGYSDLDGGNFAILDLSYTEDNTSLQPTALAVDTIGGELLVSVLVPQPRIISLALSPAGTPGSPFQGSSRFMVSGLHDVIDMAVGGAGTPTDPVRVYWADQGDSSLGIAPMIRSAVVGAELNSDVREHGDPSWFFNESFAALALSGDSRTLYYTSIDSNSVSYFALNSAAPVRHQVFNADDPQPHGIAVSQISGQVLWSSDGDDELMIADADLTSGKTTFSVSNEVQAIASGVTGASPGPVGAAPTVTGGSLSIMVSGSETKVIDASVIAVSDVDTEDSSVTFLFERPSDGFVHAAGSTVELTSFNLAELKAGILRYTHTSGSDTDSSIDFVIDDGQGNLTAQTIIIDVNARPELSASRVDVTESIVVPVTQAMLRVSDVETSDPAQLDYVVTAQPADGRFTFSDTGQVTTAFTQQDINADRVRYAIDYSAGAARVETLELTITDGDGREQAVTATLAITPFNADAPVAVSDRIVVTEGGTQSTLNNGDDSLLDNDSDAQGPLDNLRVELVDDVAHGTLALNANGTFRYEHDGSESTRVSFTYVTIDSADQRSDVTTVEIDVTPVNDPLILSGTFVLPDATEDSPYSVTIPLGIWTDEDVGDSMILSTGPLPAWLSFDAATATFSGTPTNAHVGVSNISVTARDSGGSVAAPLALSLPVNNTNDAPNAPRLFVADATVPENRSGVVVGRLLISDPDVGDNLTVSVDDARFVINGDSLEISDSAMLDFERERSVSVLVSVSDRAGAVTTTTFVLAVGDEADAPVALPDAIDAVQGGSAVQVANGADSVLDNDSAIAPGAGELRVELARAPLHGALTLNADGTFNYVHDGGESTTDTFEYVARDSSGQPSDSVMVTIAIAPFDIRIDANTVAENVAGARIGTLSALDAFTAPEVRFDTTDSRFVIEGNTLMLAPNASLDFESTPEIDVPVQATNEDGVTRTELIRLQVVDGNDVPEIVASIAPPATGADTTLAISRDVFVDADGDQLAFSATRVDGSSLPSWLVFDAEGPGFSVIDTRNSESADEAAESRVTARLVATDGRGGEVFVDLDFSRVPLADTAEPEPVPESEPVPEPVSEPVSEPEPAPVSVAVVPTLSVGVPSTPMAEEVAPPVAQEASQEKPQQEPQQETSASELLTEQIESVESADLKIDTVDIQSLVRQSGSSTVAALASTDVELTAFERLVVERVQQDGIDTVDLASLIADGAVADRRAFGDLADALERQKEEIQERASFAQTLVGSSVGISSGLSVGYLIWLIRGGTLMGSVLSSLPAWRLVDPLPILDSLAGEGDGDEESLESMVDTRDVSANEASMAFEAEAAPIANNVNQSATSLPANRGFR